MVLVEMRRCRACADRARARGLSAIPAPDAIFGRCRRFAMAASAVLLLPRDVEAAFDAASSQLASHFTRHAMRAYGNT